MRQAIRSPSKKGWTELSGEPGHGPKASHFSDVVENTYMMRYDAESLGHGPGATHLNDMVENTCLVRYEASSNRIAVIKVPEAWHRRGASSSIV